MKNKFSDELKAKDDVNVALVEFERFKNECKGRKDVDFCFTKGYRRLRIGETWDCKDCYELYISQLKESGLKKTSLTLGVVFAYIL